MRRGRPSDATLLLSSSEGIQPGRALAPAFLRRQCGGQRGTSDRRRVPWGNPTNTEARFTPAWIHRRRHVEELGSRMALRAGSRPIGARSGVGMFG